MMGQAVGTTIPPYHTYLPYPQRSQVLLHTPSPPPWQPPSIHMLLIAYEEKRDLALVDVPSLLRHEDDAKRQVYPWLVDSIQETQGVNNGHESTNFLHVQTTLLLRPTQTRPGLVAYHLPLPFAVCPNRRATCFAMTCGLFRSRFHGNVLVDFQQVPAVSPLQPEEKQKLLEQLVALARCGAVNSPDARLWSLVDKGCNGLVRQWILMASRENYHDREAIKRWINITSACNLKEETSDHSRETTHGKDEEAQASQAYQGVHDFVTNEPLCLHCRKPTSSLCNQCQGAYFCPPPRQCRQQGWSHDCLCATWKTYVNRREQLSSFPFQAPWHKLLVSRSCQISHDPYEREFLTL